MCWEGLGTFRADDTVGHEIGMGQHQRIRESGENDRWLLHFNSLSKLIIVHGQKEQKKRGREVNEKKEGTKETAQENSCLCDSKPATLRSDLTQAICSIMALLQGIATPEEDCFIQVSVFVPEGRLWLLV